jgi:FkbM family methyltransferase
MIFKKSYSQAGQDAWVIQQVFDYKIGGYFVDIGAFDGIDLSNTYWLERHLGWDGLCIEANPITFGQLQKNRKCKMANFCVGTSLGGSVEFVTNLGPHSGASQFLEKTEDSAHQQTTQVNTADLGTLLDRFNAPETIDYLTIDVEGMEDEVIKTFPFAKRRFLAATIERPSPFVRSLLESHGYLLVADMPGLDAFYLHPEMADSYLGKILRRSEEKSKGIFGRMESKVGYLLKNGLGASLKRL